MRTILPRISRGLETVIVPWVAGPMARENVVREIERPIGKRIGIIKLADSRAAVYVGPQQIEVAIAQIPDFRT
jgi:hypothetical protein